MLPLWQESLNEDLVGSSWEAALGSFQLAEVREMFWSHGMWHSCTRSEDKYEGFVWFFMS